MAALTRILDALAGENPALVVDACMGTGCVVLRGLSEAHLNFAIDSFQNIEGLTARVDPVRVCYRETIRSKAVVKCTHRRVGGKSEYAHVMLMFEPPDTIPAIEFETHVDSNAVPLKYLSAIEIAVRSEAETGVLAGYRRADSNAH